MEGCPTTLAGVTPPTLTVITQTSCSFYCWSPDLPSDNRVVSSSDRVCVKESMICDRVEDCADGIDETDCNLDQGNDNDENEVYQTPSYAIDYTYQYDNSYEGDTAIKDSDNKEVDGKLYWSSMLQVNRAFCHLEFPNPLV